MAQRLGKQAHSRASRQALSGELSSVRSGFGMMSIYSGAQTHTSAWPARPASVFAAIAAHPSTRHVFRHSPTLLRPCCGSALACHAQQGGCFPLVARRSRLAHARAFGLHPFATPAMGALGTIERRPGRAPSLAATLPQVRGVDALRSAWAWRDRSKSLGAALVARAILARSSAALGHAA